MNKPVLVEQNSGGGADWETRWFCQPPEPGIPFTVQRDEWSDDDGLVRSIYEIAILP